MQTLGPDTERLLGHPRFEVVVQRLASGFLGVQKAAPRLSSQFATQQRWLMSHAAFGCYFRSLRSGRPGVSRRAFVDLALAHGVASRNTAAAYFAEVLHYGIIRPTVAGCGGNGPAEPAPATLWALGAWYSLHLGALDTLDGGGRVERLRESEIALLTHMEPVVAEMLLACDAIRRPGPVYGMFASVDDGGSLMDRLFVGLSLAAARGEARALTDVTSVSALARPLNLSRTHAGRTLAAAIAIGGMGWSGVPGRSPLWLSRDFRTDYARVQATKLAIIGAAFDAAAEAAPRRAPAIDVAAGARQEAWDRPVC